MVSLYRSSEATMLYAILTGLAVMTLIVAGLFGSPALAHAIARRKRRLRRHRDRLG